MRPLPPSPGPALLIEERYRISGTPGVGGDWYDQLSTDAKDAVRDQRLAEQGHLCAYTEVRVTGGNLHIEHMFPQAHCSPEEKIDYDNLDVCFPRDINPGFGAIPKGDWPSELERHLFVRPVDPTCGKRFRFEATGRMVPTIPTDVAATETIKHVRLDNEPDPGNPTWNFLRNRRKAAIAESIRNLRSVEDVKRRIDALRFDPAGRLPEFVSARRQALDTQLRKLKQIRRFAPRARS